MASDGSDQVKHGKESMANQWYRFSSNAVTGGRATIDIYGEIGMWGISSAQFVGDLRYLDADEIDLNINSPGGDIYEGIAIYTALVKHQAKVNVFIDGLAASIATVIAQAGDNISIGRNAEMMIHEAWAVTVGPASEHRQAADDLDRLTANIASIYAERSGRGTTKSWLKLMGETTWFTATEAVDAGLADEVMAPGPRGGDLEASALWKNELAAYPYQCRAMAPDPVLPPRRPTTPVMVGEEGPEAVVFTTTDAESLLSLDLTDEQTERVLNLIRSFGPVPTNWAKEPTPEVEEPTPAAELARHAVRDAVEMHSTTTGPTRQATAVEASYEPPTLELPPPPKAIPITTAETVLASIQAAAVIPATSDPAPAPIESVEPVVQPPTPPPVVVPITTAETVLASIQAAASHAPTNLGEASPIEAYDPPQPEAPPPPPDRIPVNSAELVLAAIQNASPAPGKAIEATPEPDTAISESIRHGFLEVLL